MDVFISHSNKDAEFANLIYYLLKMTLRLSSSKIRCTSLEETQLIGGSDIDETLKSEILDSKVFIALLSPASINSSYVLFELGARWGADKKIFPLLMKNLDFKQISGPIKGFHIVKCDRVGLWNLIRDTGNILEIEPEPPESADKEIKRIIEYEPHNYTPLAFAVLSYVVDREFNFALLKDTHYKKIQPPGRRLQSNEYPHKVALFIASEELNLPFEDLQRIPKFNSIIFKNTRIVPQPFQIQLEQNPHRTALEHYDFVYVFFIDKVRPPIRVQTSREHKTEPKWFSIQEVEGLKNNAEYGPHEDMIPTMKEIKIQIENYLKK